MSRRKKRTTHLEDAKARLSGLKSIDKVLDLGNGLTAALYEQNINDLQDKLNAYNTILSSVDEKYNMVLDAEKQLRDLSERMLSGVAARFGKTSNEYEMAGGTRKMDRKRTGTKKGMGAALGA